MLRLNLKNVQYLIVHTAAAPFNCDAVEIDLWHKKRGFDQIGYHWVIRGSGYDNMLLSTSLIEEGRSIDYRGAHALGANYNSLGVCLTGHGDIYSFTSTQTDTLFALYFLLKMYLPHIQLIGHNEIKHYYNLNYNVLKTCPGTKNNMSLIREYFKFSVMNQKFIPANIDNLLHKNELFYKLRIKLLDRT